MIEHVTHDGVTVLTIANEAARNAISDEMADELVDLFSAADADDAVKAIVVTGAGERAFCAGHNLKQALADPATLWQPGANRCFTIPGEIGKPVIAAVNGPAYAGGLVLALSCDLRYCTPDAVFAASAVRLGLVPIGDQVTLLPQLLPPAIAMEMLLTAQPLSAERALAHGFVNAVHERGELLDVVGGVAAAIARMPRTSVRGIKQAVRATLLAGPAAGAALEPALARAAGTGPDLAEGLQAFNEKREPNYR